MRARFIGAAALVVLAGAGCSASAPDSGLKEPVKMPDQVGEWQLNTMVKGTHYGKQAGSGFISVDHADKLRGSAVKNGKNVSGAWCGAHKSAEADGYCVIKIGDGGYEVYGQDVPPDELASFMEQFMKALKSS